MLHASTVQDVTLRSGLPQGAAVRDPRDLASPDHEWPFLAVYVVSGEACVGADRLRLGAGDLTVVANTADGRVRFSGGPTSEVVVLSLSEPSIAPYRQDFESGCGHVWSVEEGTGSLVAHVLRGLARQPEGYHPENPGRLSEHVVGLISLMCADHASSDRWSRRSALKLAKEYIEANLADVDLTPDRVAAAQNVSTRTLHRLFEAEGVTVSGWIRARRIEHCRADLTDASNDGLSVSAIGARWGLWDAAHFSRLFKSTFGLSPRVYRELARNGELAAAASSGKDDRRTYEMARLA